MKIVKILLLSFSVCFFLAGTCEEDDDSKVLKPRLTPENMSLCSDVRCIVSNGDTTCFKGFDKNPLPKEHPCCQDLIPEKPNTTPDNPPPDDLPPSRLISVFIPDSSKVYGFDDGREYHPFDKYNTENRVHYLSVKENGSALFRLYVSPTLFKNFTSFTAKIENLSILSFDSSWVLDTFTIEDTLTDIKIYGRFAQPITPVRILVTGKNRSGGPKALVCDTCEEDLKVLCYREKIFDTLRIYRVNGPTYNPPDSVIRKEFNNVLKQSVLRVANVSKQQYSNTGWDNNRNSKLDYFDNKDSVPPQWLEHIKLRDSIELLYSGCASCGASPISSQQPKAFVLPSGIYENWLLMDTARVSADTIEVQYSKDLIALVNLRKYTFSLYSWDGSSSEDFKIYEVLEENPNRNRMSLKLDFYKLKYPHPRHHVLVLKNRILGFTVGGSSCAWISGTSNTRVIIHEFLHMQNVAPLDHTPKDSSNIMYPTADKSGTQLRYRELIDENSARIRQWHILITH